MGRKIEQINEFSARCGYFYNAYISKNILVNSGHNCNHPNQKTNEIVEGQKIGECYSWSCPLGYKPDLDDFKNPDIDLNGYIKPDQGELIVVEEHC